MRRLWWTLGCVLALCACSPASQSLDTGLDDVSYASVLALNVSAPAHTQTYGEDALQFAEFWPVGSGIEPKATVVIVHGGCWLNAYDLVHTRPLAAALAGQGYDVWSLEYRRTGDQGGGWPGILHDVVEGTRKVLSLSPVRPVILVGHSAGGHLALLAAEQAAVDGVVGLAAITDLERYAAGENSCQQATAAFMGGMPAERAAAYAAATLKDRRLRVPTVLLQGGVDQIVPAVHAELPGATTRLHAGAGHFDWIHPASSAYATLLATLQEMSAQ